MSSTADRISLEDVAAWLRANHYGATALELFHEVERCTGQQYTPLVHIAEETCRALGVSKGTEVAHTVERSEAVPTPTDLATSGSSHVTSTPTASPSSSIVFVKPTVVPAAGGSGLEGLVSNELTTGAAEATLDALGDCLDALITAEGRQAVVGLLTRRGILSQASLPSCDASFLPAAHEDTATADTTITGASSSILSDLKKENATLARTTRDAERQLRHIVALVSDTLATLISAVDPMKKDVLLPLLRSVAILAESSTSRAAARHAILHLFKRPTEDNRQAMVAEWLRVTQAAPQRAMEQEVIPELYGLVNARTAERRLLALDCAVAVAPRLRNSLKVRYALCQGLLRPLSEDDASAVRRRVPGCLGALWDGEGDAARCATTAIHETPSADVAASVDDGPLTSESTFPMELAVRLALDPYSNSVRHAAHAELRDVIYPKCLRNGILLSSFVPLLMAFIGMEVAPLRAEEASTVATSASQGPAAVPPERLSSPASLHATNAARSPALAPKRGEGDSNKLSKPKTNTMTLAYSNVVMLVKLVGDAMHCAKQQLKCRREGHTESTTAGIAASGSQRAELPTSFCALATGMCDVYLRVVLPTALSLLPPLLHGFGASNSRGRALLGPLCGLGATLASLVPALDHSSWERVKTYLLAALQASFTAAEDEAWSGRGSDSERRGRLMLFYVMCIRLAGEQTAFHDRHARSAPRNRVGAADGAKSSPLPSTHDVAQAFADEVGHQSAVLIQQSLITTSTTARLSTDERMRLLATCLGELGALSLGEDDKLAAGVIAVLWSCAESSAATQRLHTVSLVTRVCALPLDDHVKTTYVCPPLFALLKDVEPMVQEMAVKGLLTVAAGLTQAGAQEKVLRPTLAVVEASGCTSELTFATLHQWEELLPTMPAEPREVFLYPQLNILMDLLSDQQSRRVLALRMRQSTASTPTHNTTEVMRAGTAEEQQAQRQWEKVVDGLHSLLSAVLRCAVVTPPLVAKYLMPGIRHLASGGVLADPMFAASPLPARWQRLEKCYEQYIGSNSTLAATQQAASLLNRVRDELKRHF